MSKGKRKKGKRGKPNRPAGGAPTSAAAIAARDPLAPARASATTTDPVFNPFQPRSGSQAVGAASDRHGAMLSWSSPLREAATRYGAYALFLFGAYWLAAAYFAWYGELHWLVGPVWMVIFGLISLALGWCFMGPEVPLNAAAHAKQLSPEELHKQGLEHMWRGVWWLGGGLVVTLVTYNLAMFSGGGKYIVTTGAMLYGLNQIIRGAVQVYGPR